MVLTSFLAAGNQRFRDRIVSITGLMQDGQFRAEPVCAVLIGISQFAQHYVTIRKSPNAKWVFDASLGFNVQSLSLMVQTRNAAGIAPGADVVVNYGAHFDFTATQRAEPEKFTGLLDRLFQTQLQKSQTLVRVRKRMRRKKKRPRKKWRMRQTRKRKRKGNESKPQC